MSRSPEPPAIRPLKDGPLRVTGVSALRNSRGESVAVRRVYTLCRCGASRRKPFCDGSHAAIGFTDARADHRVPDRLDVHRGDRITVFDNRGVCSHAGLCTARLPAVWRSGVEPWIDPDAAPPEEIVRVVRACPSGALSYALDGDRQTDDHDAPEIVVSRDGPYYVRGGVPLDGVTYGDGASRGHCALCRCGHSRNKPFCDGSHWYAGFHDDEAGTIAAANRAQAASGGQWVGVGKAADFAAGRAHAVTAGNLAAALVRVDGGWRALNAACPHQGGPLAEGEVCDGAIRCPWHGYAFSLDDGRCAGGEHQAQVLPVRERDGVVEVAAPQPVRSTWTVSHVIAETLVEWGLNTVFGMVGHSNLGLAEALRVQEARKRLRYFGVRHEGAAAFACSGYAKVSGRPAACLAIAGPGATNLLTGLWDAKMDRAPVIALTGQVNTQVMGPGAFQEIDLSSAFEAVTRFSQTVLPNSNHAELAALAVKTALVERDVAHLILPDEVQALDAGDTAPGRRDGRVAASAIAPPAQPIEHAALRLRRARRPVIVAGYGARDGMAEVTALADAIGCPIVTTFKGKGLVPDDHPLAGGVLGRSGTPVASWCVSQADLLLVFGASFSDHTGIGAGAPIVQVDFDPMALGRRRPVDEAVWGDVGVSARLLRERLPSRPAAVDLRETLARRRRLWRAEKAAREQRDDGRGIASARIFSELAAAVADDAVMVVDVGNNTYSFGRYFECRRQTVVMSGYLGSIGFAFPAAMGAWAAAPDRQIVSVSGDGGFGQYMGEFLTAVKHEMPITHVLIDNHELGKISKEQRNGGWPVWRTALRNPDFAEYARLCGGRGYRVDAPGDLAPALRKALNGGGPALVDVRADPLLT